MSSGHKESVACQAQGHPGPHTLVNYEAHPLFLPSYLSLYLSPGLPSSKTFLPLLASWAGECSRHGGCLPPISIPTSAFFLITRTLIVLDSQIDLCLWRRRHSLTQCFIMSLNQSCFSHSYWRRLGIYSRQQSVRKIFGTAYFLFKEDPWKRRYCIFLTVNRFRYDA